MDIGTGTHAEKNIFLRQVLRHVGAKQIYFLKSCPALLLSDGVFYSELRNISDVSNHLWCSKCTLNVNWTHGKVFTLAGLLL